MRFWFFILLVLGGCGSSQTEAVVQRVHKREMIPLVVIDAGHGAYDLGAHSSDYEEKGICLKAAMLLRKQLEKAGYRVLMTRSRDEFVPLKKRAEMANQARGQVLVSLHCNSAKNRLAKGVEIYYTQKTEPWRAKKSKEMAQMVLSKILAETKAESRGIKDANFVVIKETKMPSILIEMGFLTNEEEQKRLKEPAYLEAMMQSVTSGLSAYFHL